MARMFGLLATLIALATAAYIYSKNAQRFTAPSPGGSLVSAPVMTGVKKDLMVIANAERSYMVQQGKYGSLEDLISGQYTTINKERPPYTYSVEITDSGFQATATRSSPGSPAQLWIDQSMQIHTSD